MKASFVDLRKKSSEIIRALDRNERVTVLYRGRPKAVMHPVGAEDGSAVSRVTGHPAFGLWAGRQDITDVADHVRKLRQGRFLDL